MKICACMAGLCRAHGWMQKTIQMENTIQLTLAVCILWHGKN